MKKLFSTLLVLLPFVFQAGAQHMSQSNDALNLSGFLPNEGQIVDQHGKVNDEVKFLFASPACNVALKSSGFSFGLVEKKLIPRSYPESGFRSFEDKEEWNADRHYQISVARVDVDLLGANRHARIVASDPDEAYCNFYNGSIGVKGLTNVPSYHQVTYQDVYPGIDLVFSVNDQNQLEYSFIVHPGANAKKIRMKFNGCDQLALDRFSNLQLNNHIGWITQTVPSAFNQNTNEPVNCRWTLKNNAIQFDLASSNQTIVIDPNVVWGTFYGGEGSEQANAELALDKKNNIIISGSTTSTTGIATTGAYQTTYAGSQDVFIAKFTNAGKLSWGTYYGGTDQEIAWSVNTDPSSNIFVAGSTQSTTGIATTGTHQTVLDGSKDIYIAKFNTNGQLVWGSYYGGAKTEQARSVACDNSGNAYLGCYTESSDGIATSGTHQTVYGGNGDAALAKFSPAGQLLWGTYYSGSEEDRAHAVYPDNKGNVFLCGTVASDSNIATAGAFQTTFGGVDDAFVAKFNASNGQLDWGTYLGGSKEDHGRAVETDKKGNVYIAGFTQSCNGIAYGNSFQSQFGGTCAASDTTYDCYVAKFSPSGTQCLWSSYWGGSANDFFYGLALDSKNNVFCDGNTLSTDLIVTANAFQPTLGSTGAHDGNLLETDSLGNLLYGTYFGKTSDESFYDLSCDKSDILYMAENTNGPGYVTPGAYQVADAGGKDYIVYKFSGNVACFDANEPNESMGTSRKIAYALDTTLYGYTAAISKASDQDWFKVTTVTADPYVKVWLKDNGSQKYSVDLYSKSGVLLMQGLPDTDGNVSIVYNGTTKGSSYFIQIVHTNLQFDSINCYRLLVGASASPFLGNSKREQQPVISRQLSIQPNPVNDLFRLRFDADKNAGATIRIYNVEEQMVFQTTVTTVPGNNEFMIKLPILSAGEYLLQWQQDADVRTEKLIITPSR